MLDVNATRNKNSIFRIQFIEWAWKKNLISKDKFRSKQNVPILKSSNDSYILLTWSESVEYFTLKTLYWCLSFSYFWRILWSFFIISFSLKYFLRFGVLVDLDSFFRLFNCNDLFDLWTKGLNLDKSINLNYNL